MRPENPNDQRYVDFSLIQALAVTEDAVLTEGLAVIGNDNEHQVDSGDPDPQDPKGALRGACRRG